MMDVLSNPYVITGVVGTLVIIGVGYTLWWRRQRGKA